MMDFKDFKDVVWTGISWEGKTPIVIFEGMMNATGIY